MRPLDSPSVLASGSRGARDTHSSPPSENHAKTVVSLGRWLARDLRVVAWAVGRACRAPGKSCRAYPRVRISRATSSDRRFEATGEAGSPQIDEATTVGRRMSALN